MSVCRSPCARLGTYYGEKTTRDLTSDVTVLVGATAFKCHKFVLMSHSKWFNKKILEDYDNPSLTIVLPDISEEVFDKLHKWMYTCKIKVVEDIMLLNVMDAAKYLGMKKLLDVLSERVPSDLSPVNVMGKFADSLEAGDDFKSQAIAQYMGRNFRMITNSHAFLLYSGQEVSWLFALNELGINNEKAVLVAATNWLRHRWPERQHYISRIMTWVRFGLMSDADLLEFSFDKTNEPICSVPKVRDMVLRAFMYHIAMENNIIDVRFFELQPLDRVNIHAPHKAYMRVVCNDPCHPTLYPNVLHVTQKRKPTTLKHFERLLCGAESPRLTDDSLTPRKQDITSNEGSVHEGITDEEIAASKKSSSSKKSPASQKSSASKEKKIISDSASKKKKIISDSASKKKKIISDSASKEKKIISDSASKEKKIIFDSTSKEKTIIPDSASKAKKIIRESASKENETMPDSTISLSALGEENWMSEPILCPKINQKTGLISQLTSGKKRSCRAGYFEFKICSSTCSSSSSDSLTPDTSKEMLALRKMSEESSVKNETESQESSTDPEIQNKDLFSSSSTASRPPSSFDES